MKRTFKKFLFIIPTLLIISVTASASGSSFDLPSVNGKYKIYDGGSNYTPDNSSFPLNKDDVKSIGFDALYGSTKSLIRYRGEIPKSISDEEDMDKFRTFNGDKIDGVDRPWSNNSGLSPESVVPESDDPHIKSMTSSKDLFSIGSFTLSIFSGIHWVFSQIVNMAITVNNLDPSSILGLIDNDGGLSKQLSTIFLINPDTGALSPFLVFGLFGFVISIVGVGFRVMKGDISFKNLFEEVWIFVIAICLAAIFLNPTNANKLSNIGINVVTSLANSVVTAVSDSTSIFTYETEDPLSDASKTQKALISKTYIDQLISAQMGYPVSDLYIVNRNGGVGGFGDQKDISEALAKTFSEGNINSLVVSNDISGEKSINNLGYYFWAANSSTHIYNGEDNSKPVFYVSGGENIVRTGSSDRILYAVDFLSNLRKIKENNGEDAIVAKIDKVMKNITTPDFGKAISGVMLLSVQNIVLSISLIMIIVFSLLGTAIISLGSYAIVIMPFLTLIKPTRSVARQMAYSYIFGFIRFIIGASLFNAVILISTLLSQQGLGGIILSIFVSILIAKFGPKLLQELNIYISQMGRGKELRAVSNASRHVDRMFDRYTPRRGSIALINEDGDIENQKSLFETVQRGLKGDNSLSRIFSDKQEKELADSDDIVGFDEESSLSDKKDENEIQSQDTNTRDNFLPEINDSSVQGLGANTEDDTIDESNDLLTDGVSKSDIEEMEDTELSSNGSRNRRFILDDNANDIDQNSNLTDIKDSENSISNRGLDNEITNPNTEKIILGERNSNREKNELNLDIDMLEDSSESLDEGKIILSRGVNKDDIIRTDEARGTSNDDSNIAKPLKLRSKISDEIKLNSKNTVLRAAGSIPIVGTTVNKHIAEKMTESTKSKEEIQKVMESLLMKSDSMSLDEAFEKSKNIILKDVGRIDKRSKEKFLEKSRNSFTKEDIKDINERIKAKKEPHNNMKSESVKRLIKEVLEENKKEE